MRFNFEKRPGNSLIGVRRYVMTIDQALNNASKYFNQSIDSKITLKGALKLMESDNQLKLLESESKQNLLLLKLQFAEKELLESRQSVTSRGIPKKVPIRIVFERNFQCQDSL